MTVPQFEPIAAGLLAEGRSIRFRADGWSMTPAIHPGDTLLIEPIGERIFVGDIVFFLQGERPLVHRVIAISKDGGTITTRGDGSERRDPPVPRSAILGRLVSVERDGAEIQLAPEGRSKRTVRRLMDVLRRMRAGR